MSWTQKPLAEVAELCLGKMLDEKKNKGELMPYLANVNVRWGKFDLDGLREMRFEPHERERYGLKSGDIVMCEGGEPGRCAIWKDEVPGMMIQKALHRIRPREELDHRFLYYQFLLKGRADGFSGLFTGSTIKHLPGQNLAKVEVSYPSRSEQERIAEVLSAYDDLIENNRRRIALLEESARLLYREWFVHLRFPGHEHVKMVEGLPEGWSRKRLAELVSPQYGFTETASTDMIGPKFLRGTDINKRSYVDWSSVPFCPIDDQQKRKYALKRGDIVVIRMADPGKVAIIEEDVDAVFASYLIRFNLVSDNLRPYYLFFSLDSEDYQAFVGGSSTGATRKTANASLLTSFPLCVPTVALQMEFEDSIKPLRGQITVLLRQNAKLRQARDLLLPRLMSGQIQPNDTSYA
ncbi:restriction endonuclease subunit S [Luteimonas sp. MHLX1A]|uniref:restriction endonuclease subunit S n=1 Tax=Alterluteimonas muca TaxID=2878684 RepID=UPI001E55ECB4|nr:restriction endonuclease subunit S [Luteimonas sp. MHLX1A]